MSTNPNPPRNLAPQDLYELGTGLHLVHVRLTRLESEPVVIYDGPATLNLETLDRVKQRKRVKGYPDQDFWFSVSAPGIAWAESSRRSYELGELSDAYIDEDYQTEVFAL